MPVGGSRPSRHTMLRIAIGDSGGRLVTADAANGPNMTSHWGAFAFATLAFVASPTYADQLVMFEQAGCPYCAAWDREVGHLYAKTDEAKRLPLRRVDIHGPRPDDLRSVRAVAFTPTFVVMHCGREYARITGYIGEDQFWGLLDRSLAAIADENKAKRTCSK